MPLYTCPFCKMEIEDTVASLLAHREEDGVCDKKMLQLYPDLGDK
jgi:hypothetical protein